MKKEIFVSIVLIVKNQTEQLINYLEQLSPYMDERYSDYEIVIIDQNSADGIESKLAKALLEYQSIRHIRLVHEVSSDVALAAGLENAIGDFVVNLNIDSDSVELISSLVERGLEGNDIVICVSKKVTSFWYKNIRKLTAGFIKTVGYNLPCNSTGTFCFSRRSVNTLTESGRFYCKLYMRIANIGYTPCPFVCDDFIANVHKKSLVKGIKETVHHMVFNSTKPLRWMSVLGMSASFIAMIFSLYSIIINLFKDQVAPGWTTTIFFMSTLFALLFIMVSFFGEYLARLLNEQRDHREYNTVYERNSSVMLNEKRSNVLFMSVSENLNSSQTGRNR